jgi:hypothetical protein
MPASFQEVFASAGVDEDAWPRPGRVVPLGGFNVVRLAGGRGLRLDAPQTLKIEEFLGSPAAAIATLSLIFDFSSAFRPAALGDSRYFKISGAVATGAAPIQVKAVRSGQSKPDVILDVAVLRRRKVKLSIRPVQVRGPNGALVFHSKKPFDVADMVSTMNDIWTPQANLAFELVSSNPAPLTDEEQIAKAYDQKETNRLQLPSMVVLDRMKGILSGFKGPGADLTMFLVEQCGHLDPPALRNITADEGITAPDLGIALISDGRTRVREVMAHEAGHFVGSRPGQNFGHTNGPHDLMHDGGRAEAKIPFHDVISFFNRP